jgi:2-methylisocitrate lyase-like PEP mutase family enzyme
MGCDLSSKAAAFRALHEGDGCFVMANAWDAGSARILAAEGFPALATTSAGVNFALGRADYTYEVPRAEMLAAYGRVAAAVDLPVSGDLENGYGDAPETVAETIRLAIEQGLVGGGIEDHTGDPKQPLYDIELAAERIGAARAAADASGIPFTLTARAECFLVGHPDPFAESLRRAKRYREAGADCLFVPGVKDAETIGALVREVDGPVSVVMGLAGEPLSLAELTDLGVRRVSVGGSLARTALGALRRAAREIAAQGTFTYARDAIPDRELGAFFAGFGEDKG